MSTEAWRVLYHPDAAAERAKLPPNERSAMGHAVEKLEALGPRLGFPHSSAIQTATDLRELRPRGGRSPWRAFYRQMTPDAFVIGAVGPEAQHDPRGFARAVAAGERRLDDLGREDDR
jgi:hypothetical protein